MQKANLIRTFGGLALAAGIVCPSNNSLSDDEIYTTNIITTNVFERAKRASEFSTQKIGKDMVTGLKITAETVPGDRYHFISKGLLGNGPNADYRWATNASLTALSTNASVFYPLNKSKPSLFIDVLREYETTYTQIITNTVEGPDGEPNE